jgi:hypothetical protein
MTDTTTGGASRSGGPARRGRPAGRPRRRVRTAARLAVALAAVAGYSATLVTTTTFLPSSQAATVPATVVASADATVQSDTPDTNYGSATSLGVRGVSTTAPLLRSYVKVVVAGLGQAPASARLNLYTYATSATGVKVSLAANTWTETGVTWANAPAVGADVATVAPLSSNTAVSADVTSAVTGDGTYTFVITTTSAAGKTFASREVTAHPPTLVLDTSAPAPTATATPVASGSVTASPTGTASPTATVTPTGTASATGTVTPTGTGNPTGTVSVAPAAVTTTFGPSADGYVEADTPTTSYGGGYQLNTQAPSSTTPEERTYLTFPVSGLSGPVTSATLKLYTYSTWASGVTVATADTSWTEPGLTWATAPATGAVVGTGKNLVVNTTVSVDVTGAVAGNGMVGLVVTTDRPGLVKFGSREATANRPQLVVTTGGTATPTPTLTTTPTATSTTAAPSATTATASPTGPSPTVTSGDPTIVAAGDIACPAGGTAGATSCQQQATSDLALSLNPTAVLPLGDEQYELGSLADFKASYGPSWGRMNAIAHPAPGNHEYGYIGSSIQPTGGEGYFTYFGDRAHPLSPGCTKLCTSWYSWNIGAWHMISLDSQCGVVGGCNPGNPQYQWLLNDLNASTAKCTLAYWHIPLYSSSTDHQPDMQAIYSLLYQKKADVVLTGHAHFYERFAGQDGAGNADPVNGLAQFVVGSGGKSFFAMRATPAANSAAQIANTFGVLQMTLGAGGYSWKFVPSTSGGGTDAGTAACH